MNTDLFDHLKKEGHAGLVLFSSGSTGDPKIVLHDWNKLAAKALGTKRNPKYKNAVVLSMLGLDHIGGVNTMLFCLANQCELVFPKSRRPADVLEAIETHRVNILPTTPSFLRMLLLHGISDYDISSLQLISYGTEPMDENLLEKLNETFPNVTLKQTYGLTEVGILSTKSRAKDSLEMKVGGEGYETRIVDGMLEIKADTSMVGYLNAPSPFTADGFFRTYDRVESDGEYLKILGRDSDFINVGGEKVNPLDVELAIMPLPEVEDCAAYGVANPILGQVVGVTIQTDSDKPSAHFKQLIRSSNRLPIHAKPMVVKLTKENLVSNRMKKVRRND